MTGGKRTVKVAIIGSGLAGLTAAFLLSSANSESGDVEFEVHVFDKVCNGKFPLDSRPHIP
jgi:flavin-dependent dehydrogenase